uniref:Homeobox domain-containing protein n=1 Tax=Coccolithus braarudii TaxID=221442 RepID=A0A7S0LJ94_9EUKA
MPHTSAPAVSTEAKSDPPESHPERSTFPAAAPTAKPAATMLDEEGVLHSDARVAGVDNKALAGEEAHSKDDPLVEEEQNDEEVQGGEGAPLTRRRVRHRYTLNNIKVLERCFHSQPFPSQVLRAELAKKVGVSSRSIQIWFQNRRAKWKGQQERAPPGENVSLWESKNRERAQSASVAAAGCAFAGQSIPAQSMKGPSFSGAEEQAGPRLAPKSQFPLATATGMMGNGSVDSSSQLKHLAQVVRLNLQMVRMQQAKLEAHVSELRNGLTQVGQVQQAAPAIQSAGAVFGSPQALPGWQPPMPIWNESAALQPRAVQAAASLPQAMPIPQYPCMRQNPYATVPSSYYYPQMMSFPCYRMAPTMPHVTAHPRTEYPTMPMSSLGNGPALPPTMNVAIPVPSRPGGGRHFPGSHGDSNFVSVPQRYHPRTE